MLVPLVLRQHISFRADPAVVPVEALASNRPARFDANKQHLPVWAKLFDYLPPRRRVDAVLLDASVQVIPVAFVPLCLFRGEHNLFGLEELLVQRAIQIQRIRPGHRESRGIGPSNARVVGGGRRRARGSRHHCVRHGDESARVRVTNERRRMKNSNKSGHASSTFVGTFEFERRFLQIGTRERLIHLRAGGCVIEPLSLRHVPSPNGGVPLRPRDDARAGHSARRARGPRRRCVRQRQIHSGEVSFRSHKHSLVHRPPVPNHVRSNLSQRRVGGERRRFRCRACVGSERRLHPESGTQAAERFGR